MKTINILFAALAIAISLVSCKPENVQMTTVVNEDGSFARTVRFEVDSIRAMKHKLVVDVLGSLDWCKEWDIVEEPADSVKLPASSLPENVIASEALVIMQTEHEDGLVTTEVYEPGQYTPREARRRIYCTATREFKNVDELNANYPIEINGMNILKNATLSYSLRGLFTDVTFTEEYVDLSPCFAVPHDKYLTMDELTYWLFGYPNLNEGLPGNVAQERLNDLCRRFENWVQANKVYDMLTVLSSNISSFKDCPLQSDNLLALRDSIYVNSRIAEEILAKVGDLTAKGTDVILGTDYFMSAEKQIELNNLMSAAKVDDKYVNIAGGDCIIYRLVMPGEITSAGTGKLLEDGSVEYAFSGLNLLTPNYTITATSRIINYWFIALVLLLIITPIALTVIIRSKK